MLKVFHAPNSRSTRLLWLLEELGADYEVQYVSVQRMDGSGGVDPANPHPLGQVPAIEHHGQVIPETVVIFQYLSDLYADADIVPSSPEARAAVAGWLGLYNAVLEPVITARFRDPNGGTTQQHNAYDHLCKVWKEALENGDYLLGQDFSAADILFASLLLFFRAAMPADAIYDKWLERLSARPAFKRAQAKNAAPN